MERLRHASYAYMLWMKTICDVEVLYYDVNGYSLIISAFLPVLIEADI